MSPKFTRSTLKFEYYKRVNTDNTPFRAILYLVKDSNRVLIENPDSCEAFLTTEYELKNYIKIEKLETPWAKNIDGSYLKFEGDVIKHILPLHNEISFANLHIEIGYNYRNFEMIRCINEKHFKITKDDKGNLSIKAAFPIWNLWGMVSRNRQNSSLDGDFRLNQLYMKINGSFYRFPYGNVNQSNNVCTGRGRSNFERVDQIWPSFITTRFNTDYGFNFKSHDDKDQIRMRLGGERREKYTIKVPTFDLDHINMLIQLKNFNKIGIIDGLYYLSNIEEVEDETVINFLFKIPTMPWEDKK